MNLDSHEFQVNTRSTSRSRFFAYVVAWNFQAKWSEYSFVEHTMCVCVCSGYVLTLTRCWHTLALQRERKRERSRRRARRIEEIARKTERRKQRARLKSIHLHEQESVARELNDRKTSARALQWHAAANLITMRERAKIASARFTLTGDAQSKFSSFLSLSYRFLWATEFPMRCWIVGLLDVLVCVRCSCRVWPPHLAFALLARWIMQFFQTRIRAVFLTRQCGRKTLSPNKSIKSGSEKQQRKRTKNATRHSLHTLELGRQQEEEFGAASSAADLLQPMLVGTCWKVNAG